MMVCCCAVKNVPRSASLKMSKPEKGPWCPGEDSNLHGVTR
jgi:hypothetical protein